jgi:hypothetical protein
MVEVLLNLQAILLTSGLKTTSGLAAAILNFWLPVSSSSVRNNFIEKLDPKNAGVVVGISSLSRLYELRYTKYWPFPGDPEESGFESGVISGHR